MVFFLEWHECAVVQNLFATHAVVVPASLSTAVCVCEEWTDSVPTQKLHQEARVNKLHALTATWGSAGAHLPVTSDQSMFCLPCLPRLPASSVSSSLRARGSPRYVAPTRSGMIRKACTCVASRRMLPLLVHAQSSSATISISRIQTAEDLNLCHNSPTPRHNHRGRIRCWEQGNALHETIDRHQTIHCLCLARSTYSSPLLSQSSSVHKEMHFLVGWIQNHSF